MTEAGDVGLTTEAKAAEAPDVSDQPLNLRNRCDQVVSESPSLATRLAAGEPGAFEEVVAAYQSRVARLAYRMLGWRSSDVDDAVQDVFLSALLNAKRVRRRHERDLWPWLAAVTVNTCRTRRRRAWVRETFLRRRRRPSDLPATPPADEPESQRQAARRVLDAIDRLAARDREVIVLHCLEEMRISDVAEVLGVSANAVQVRLHRARQRLKTELEK